MVCRRYSIPTKARSLPATALPACCSITASPSVWMAAVEHCNIFVERLWRTVKYEEIYLKKHDRLQDLIMGLTSYFLFYNEERRHQALDYQTPSLVYQTAKGGGAKIVDKFNSAKEALTPRAEEEGQRHSAVI